MSGILSTQRVLFAHFARELPQGLGTAGVGEERWAMNIAQYCLDKGYEVYTRPGSGTWKAPFPPPPNFHPETLPPDGDVTVFGEPYWPGNLSSKLEVYLLFDQPHKAVDFKGKRVVVHSYPSGQRINGLRSRYKNQNLYVLPHLVDIVHEDDGFNRLNIFWTSKSHFRPSSQNLVLPQQVMYWIARQMEKDSRITFSMTTMTHGKSYPQAREEVRGSALFQSTLAKFGKRVILKGYMSYDEMKETMARSKMIINMGNFGHTYGGSPIEAACYGIPSIQYGESPFTEMPGVIVKSPGDIGGHIQELDRLFNDKAYYEHKAEQYKRYAQAVYGRASWERVMKMIVNNHSRE